MDLQKENKIFCSNVIVKKSSFSNVDTGDFDGAFAAIDFKKGECCKVLDTWKVEGRIEVEDCERVRTRTPLILVSELMLISFTNTSASDCWSEECLETCYHRHGIY
jgi:hypothetical protein